MIVHNEIPMHLHPEDCICFHCYQLVVPPMVAWMGSTAEIVMHPACVVELAIRLFRDVHEIEKTTQRYVTGPRSVEEWRRQLVASEHGT